MYVCIGLVMGQSWSLSPIVSQHHHVPTPTPPHSIIPTLHHSHTPSFPHSIIPTLHYSCTPSLPYCFTPALPHPHIPSSPYSLIPTLPHPHTPSSPRRCSSLAYWLLKSMRTFVLSWTPTARSSSMLRPFTCETMTRIYCTMG